MMDKGSARSVRKLVVFYDSLAVLSFDTSVIDAAVKATGAGRSLAERVLKQMIDGAGIDELHDPVAVAQHVQGRALQLNPIERDIRDEIEHDLIEGVPGWHLEMLPTWTRLHGYSHAQVAMRIEREGYTLGGNSAAQNLFERYENYP